MPSKHWQRNQNPHSSRSLPREWLHLSLRNYQGWQRADCQHHSYKSQLVRMNKAVSKGMCMSNNPTRSGREGGVLPPPPPPPPPPPQVKPCCIPAFHIVAWAWASLVPRLPPVRAVKKITEGESLVRFRT